MLTYARAAYVRMDVSASYYVRVLMLKNMCPHTAVHVSSSCYKCTFLALHVRHKLLLLQQRRNSLLRSVRRGPKQCVSIVPLSGAQKKIASASVFVLLY
jgi:hypothetical protein